MTQGGAAAPLTLLLLPGRVAVARLGPLEPIPAWAATQPFFSITRTAGELSIACAEHAVPQGVVAERGWRMLQVQGVLDFALVGILASLAAPLAQAGISIFSVSTFDTDAVLVKEDKRAQAIAALRAAGHQVIE